MWEKVRKEKEQTCYNTENNTDQANDTATQWAFCSADCSVVFWLLFMKLLLSMVTFTPHLCAKFSGTTNRQVLTEQLLRSKAHPHFHFNLPFTSTKPYCNIDLSLSVTLLLSSPLLSPYQFAHQFCFLGYVVQEAVWGQTKPANS